MKALEIYNRAAGLFSQAVGWPALSDDEKKRLRAVTVDARKAIRARGETALDKAAAYLDLVSEYAKKT